MGNVGLPNRMCKMSEKAAEFLDENDKRGQSWWDYYYVSKDKKVDDIRVIINKVTQKLKCKDNEMKQQIKKTLQEFYSSPDQAGVEFIHLKPKNILWVNAMVQEEAKKILFFEKK